MKEIIYKYKKPIDYYFYLVILIGTIGLYGFGIFRIILSFSKNIQHDKLIFTVLFGVLILLIIYVLVQIVIMYKQYDEADRNKIVEVNNNERSMLIRQNELKSILVHNEDIEHVEIFEPWSVGYPLGYFSYIKINLKQSNSLIITGFTLPLGEFDIINVLKGTKKLRNKKFFNRIK
jgi:hypothetical protein